MVDSGYDDDAMMAMLATLAIDENTAQYLVKVEGFNDLDSLLKSDTETIKVLCKRVRKSRGRVHGHDDDDAPVVAPGNPISELSELNLTKTVFYLKHMKRTSRIPHPDNITIARIMDLEGQELAEKTHEDMPLPSAKEFIRPSKSWPEIFESLDNILRKSRGSTGIPLMYCVRKDESVAEDPAEGWRSYDEEMIYRAPIKVNDRYDPQFLRDNAKVRSVWK